MRRQFAGLLLSRGLGSVLQAVTLVVLARQVSAATFGAVSVVIATAGVVLVVSGFGLAVFIPQARARGEDEVVAAALRLNSWMTVFAAAVLSTAVGAWLVTSGGPLGAVLVGVSLTLERNVETYLGVSLGDGDARTTAVSVLLRRSLTLAVFCAGLLVHLEPVWSLCTGLLVGALVAQVHVRRAVRGLLVGTGTGTGSVGVARVVRESSPYLVANLSAQIRTLDVTVVAALLPAVATGLYAGASKLVQPLLLVPQSIAAVVAPRSTAMSGQEARRLAGRLALLFGAALVVGSPAIVWAEQLVVLVMGPSFAGAGPALAWSLGGVPLLAMSSTFVAILQGQGRARAAAANAATFGVVLLVLVAVGAATAGVGGAAAGLTLSYVPRVLVLVWMIHRIGRDPVPGVPSSG